MNNFKSGGLDCRYGGSWHGCRWDGVVGLAGRLLALEQFARDIAQPVQAAVLIGGLERSQNQLCEEIEAPDVVIGEGPGRRRKGLQDPEMLPVPVQGDENSRTRIELTGKIGLEAEVGIGVFAANRLSRFEHGLQKCGLQIQASAWRDRMRPGSSAADQFAALGQSNQNTVGLGQGQDASADELENLVQNKALGLEILVSGGACCRQAATNVVMQSGECQKGPQTLLVANAGENAYALLDGKHRIGRCLPVRPSLRCTHGRQQKSARLTSNLCLSYAGANRAVLPVLVRSNNVHTNLTGRRTSAL